MAVLDTVIYDIERCICHVPDACKDCSHGKKDRPIDCMENLFRDALELLKEQSKIINRLQKDVAYLQGALSMAD